MVERKVEGYSDPTPAGYKFRSEYEVGEQVPLVIDGLRVGNVAVDDLLP